MLLNTKIQLFSSLSTIASNFLTSYSLIGAYLLFFLKISLAGMEKPSMTFSEGEMFSMMKGKRVAVIGIGWIEYAKIVRKMVWG